MVNAIPTLPIARYQLRFRALRPIAFNGYTGSAWRGAFGHALKKTVCITKAAQCSRCLLYRSCIYPEVFETPLPEGAAMRSAETIPHPFILEIPWRCPEPKHEVSLGISLFGRADKYLAYIVHAFSRLGAEGIQKSGPLELFQVSQEGTLGSDDWRVIYSGEAQLTPLKRSTAAAPPIPERCRITFDTPLRLRVLNEYVKPDRFRFGDLLRNLLGRISSLQRFHSETPLEADFAHLVATAHSLEFKDLDVRWTDWLRFSSRQNQRLAMGGLMGTAVLDFRAIEPFWPILWLGQFTHAGKGTSMGLGSYRIRPDIAGSR